MSPALRDLFDQLGVVDTDREVPINDVEQLVSMLLVEGIKIGGIYQHWKGKEYLVKSISRDCEDWDKFLVTYVEVTDARHEATRRVSYFLEDLGDGRPRFKLVG